MARDLQKAVSIPEPTNDVDSLWNTTKFLKEAVETIQGIRGNRTYALECDLTDQIADLQVQVNNGGGGGSGLSASADETITGSWDYTGGLLMADDTDLSFGTGGDWTIDFDTGTGTLKIRDIATGGALQVREGNTLKFAVDHANSLIDIRDAYTLRIRNSADDDYLDVRHNGTNILLTPTQTSAVVFGTDLQCRTAASSTTRAGFRLPEGTAPSSPTDGDVWVTTTDIVARVNGVSESLLGGADTEVVKHKTADQTKDNNTFTDDTHLDAWDIDAASKYKIEGFLRVQAANANPDVKFRFQTSQAFEGSWVSMVGMAEDRSVDGDSGIATLTFTFPLAAGVGQGIHIHGFIDTHATNDGVLDFQWAQINTDAVNLTTVYEGSWISIKKM